MATRPTKKLPYAKVIILMPYYTLHLCLHWWLTAFQITVEKDRRPAYSQSLFLAIDVVSRSFPEDVRSLKLDKVNKAHVWPSVDSTPAIWDPRTSNAFRQSPILTIKWSFLSLSEYWGCAGFCHILVIAMHRERLDGWHQGLGRQFHSNFTHSFHTDLFESQVPRSSLPLQILEAFLTPACFHFFRPLMCSLFEEVETCFLTWRYSGYCCWWTSVVVGWQKNGLWRPTKTGGPLLTD